MKEFFIKTAFAAAENAEVSESASELASIIERFIKQIPLIIAGFFLMIFAVFLAKILRSIVENKLAERGIEEEHKELQVLAGRVIFAGILTIGITAGLKVAGIDITSIIAAGAFGIGFALKDLIMNFLAGIMILLGKQFTIGDFIEVNGTLGKIIEIQSRTTILKATNGTKIIVPNADLFTKQVTSFTSNPMRRFDVELAIDYENNLENAIELALKAARESQGVLLEPKPSVSIGDFTEKGISMKVKAWCDSKGGWVKIRSRVIKNIKKSFDEHGVIIPYPVSVLLDSKNVDKKQEKLLSEEIEKEAKTNPSNPVNIAQGQAVNQNFQQQSPQEIPAQQTQTPAQTIAQNLNPTSQNLAPQTAPIQQENQPLKPIGEQ